MNYVVLMGRLAQNPELRYSRGEDSIAVANYVLAVDRRGRKEEQGQQTADFLRCIVFGRGAEFADKYFRKGQRVLISGRIQTGSYTNREGQKIYTTDIVVDNQEFADSKGVGSEANEGAGSGKGAGERKPDRNISDEGFTQIPEGVDDEGLPFN